ncbi:MAG: nucleotidyltransferase substrate binding protein [Bacteroidetes bacterium]|nr:nucleotidyltransferase substrate binding protein [Bacteroidota bacterium]
MKIYYSARSKLIITARYIILQQKSRNLASHAYDEEMAKEIVEKTKTNYYGLFLQLETRLQLEKINQENNG